VSALFAEHFKEPLLQGRVLDVVPPLLLSENETVRTGTLILLSNLSTVGSFPSGRVSCRVVGRSCRVVEHGVLTTIVHLCRGGQRAGGHDVP
jgi:hypothetical protein